MVLDFLAVDNFDITRKNVKKEIGGKTRENVGVWSKLVKIDFLDKNIQLRLVPATIKLLRKVERLILSKIC